MSRFSVWLTGFMDPTPEGEAAFFQHLAARYGITPERAATSVSRKNGVVFNVDERTKAEQGRAFLESIGGIAAIREHVDPPPAPVSPPLPPAAPSLPAAPLPGGTQPAPGSHRPVKTARPGAVEVTPGQPVCVFFRPLIDISFPGRCAGCFSERPSEKVSLGVERATKMFTGRRVGMFGGGLIGGVVGAVAGGVASGFSGETSAYMVHVCPDCNARLTDAHREGLGGQGDTDLLPEYLVRTPILDRDIRDKCIVLTFKNHEFGAAFVAWNRGLVFDSIEKAKKSKARPFNASTSLFSLLGDQPIPPLSPQTPEFEAKVVDILFASGPADAVVLGADLTPDTLELARTAAKAPARDTYLGLIDLTAFGSCKEAILFGSRGIHFPPCSPNATPHDCHLKYQEFVGRDFSGGPPNRLVLDADRVLDINNLSSQKRHVVSILHAISQLITGYDPSRQPEPAADEEEPEVEPTDASPSPLQSPEPGPMAEPVTYEDPKQLVRSVLAAHAGKPGLFLQGSIPDKKAMNARATCQVPPREILLGLIDLTVFGSAKNCLVFGTSGIYFHNAGTGTTPGTFFVPYAEFPHHDFGREPASELAMGGGTCLSLIAATPEMKAAIPDILHRIKSGMPSS